MKLTEAYKKFIVEAEELPQEVKEASKNTLELFLNKKDLSFEDLIEFIENHPESNIQKDKIVKYLQGFNRFFDEGNYAVKLRRTGKGDEEFDPKEIEAGMEVEKEHTKDDMIALKIARDHLTEFPDYYKRLKKANL